MSEAETGPHSLNYSVSVHLQKKFTDSGSRGWLACSEELTKSFLGRAKLLYSIFAIKF